MKSSEDSLFQLRVTVADNVLSQKTGDEYVLYNTNDGTYFGLDEVGAEMWNSITTHPTIQLSFNSLLGSFNVEPERLENDLRAFVANVSKNGLIRLSGSSEEG